VLDWIVFDFIDLGRGDISVVYVRETEAGRKRRRVISIALQSERNTDLKEPSSEQHESYIEIKNTGCYINI
jgi:hypothetical protein